MTLAEWTFSSGIQPSSDTSIPSEGGVPSVKGFVDVGSTTRRYFVPTGNTINGQSIIGLDSGSIVCWWKVNTTLSSDDGHNWIIFRRIDDSNYYGVRFRQHFDDFQIVRRTTATDNTVGSGSASLFMDTWHKVRVTWWEALGSIWIRVELWNGSGFDLLTTVSDSNNSHKSSTNKVVLGMDSGSSTNLSCWFENMEIYKKL